MIAFMDAATHPIIIDPATIQLSVCCLLIIYLSRTSERRQSVVIDHVKNVDSIDQKQHICLQRNPKAIHHAEGCTQIVLYNMEA